MSQLNTEIIDFMGSMYHIRTHGGPDTIPPTDTMDRLRADEAERVIHERAAKTENVILTDHLFDRVDLRSIVAEDVYWILQTGRAEGMPVLEDGGVDRNDVAPDAGDPRSGVVTAIVEDDEKVIAITVEWMDLDR